LVLYNVEMRNIEIAILFNRIADLLEIQGANSFRVRAYQRAAANLESLTDNIESIVSRGAVREIPGIGEDLAAKISEFLTTGSIKFYDDLKVEVPLGLLEIVTIPSVGPKTAKKIYDRFHVKDVDHLDQLARSGKLLAVQGFKQKTVDNIIHGIEIARRRRGSQRCFLVEEDLHESRHGLDASPRGFVRGQGRRARAKCERARPKRGHASERRQTAETRARERAHANDPASAQCHASHAKWPRTKKGACRGIRNADHGFSPPRASHSR